MEKTILILATLILFSACSKDDEKSDTVEVKHENLWGTWYFSKVIQPDGTIVPYTHLCPTQRDYITVTTLNKIILSTNNTVCTNYTNYDCSSFGLTGNELHGCNSKFDGFVSLTTSTFRIDYPTVRHVGYPDNNLGQAKGIIFTKN